MNFETTENEDLNSALEAIEPKIKRILEVENDTLEVLMRQNEISSMKRKFEDGITALLEDAKRRKQDLFANNLPWWGWVLIVLFGFNDALRWVTSIWIVPILLLVGTLFVLKKTNKMNEVKNFYYDVEDKIFSLKKKLFK